MATKPLTLILGILHPKLHLDEVDSSIKLVFDKIGERIQDVTKKELKLAQDQLQFNIVRLQNKFSNHAQRHSHLRCILTY